MAFGNYQNDKKQKSKNTRGYQFYNKEISGSTLVIGHWNSAVTLKIHPLLPENKRTDSSVYDYESFVNVALTPQKVYDLVMGLNTVKIAVDSGIYNFDSVGVASGTGYIEVGPISKYGYQGEGVAIALYNDIGSDGKPAQKLVYVFNKSNYFKNYSVDDGSYDKSNQYEAEFGMMVMLLQEALKASTNAIAHSVRHTNMYHDDFVSDSLNSLKEKLGIEVGSSRRGGNGSSTTYFNANRRDEDNNTNFGSIDNGGMVTEDRLPM